MHTQIVLFCACALSSQLYLCAGELDDKHMHPAFRRIPNNLAVEMGEEKEEFWTKKAQNKIQEKLKQQELNKNIAKNVIMFLGDGMSIPTLAATRMYLGGEEQELSFDKFHYTGLSKTYCVDHQVADSACSATAYLCGIKGNTATIGVNAAVQLGDCEAMRNTSNHIHSIAKWSQMKGKSTGIVTTTRVTHASPAGVYANTAHRNWESDTDVIKDNVDPKLCSDIAHQLISNEVGSKLNVILGGGRRELLPDNFTDDEGKLGARSDNRNLIEEWLERKSQDSKTAKYVWNRNDLLGIGDEYNYVLGLFSDSHLPYNLDRDNKTVPSLAEMTETAIKILKRTSEKGYFLFVEGGRIDHAHHATLAKKSFDETAEFSKAIQKAVDLTSEDDTLIVVTSDHAHTMSISGYAERHNNILGIAGNSSDDLPYTTISYANGPGYRAEDEDGRYNVSQEDTTANDYAFSALVPLGIETHGGDDVAIFARGPWAHLFSGVIEQNTIPHIMAYASCVKEEFSACSSAWKTEMSVFLLFINFVCFALFGR